jgi:nucleotide-binding universal stress UspA family protein
VGVPFGTSTAESGSGLASRYAISTFRGAVSNDFRIVVAIDLNAGTDRLVQEVQRYALALDAMVDIIHVAAPDPDFVGYPKSGHPAETTQDNLIRQSEAKALRGEHQQTQGVADLLRAKGVRVDQALTIRGPTLAAIMEQTKKLNASLLVLGSHQHSAFHRMWFGDVAAAAARQAPCPVLIVPLPE